MALNLSDDEALVRRSVKISQCCCSPLICLKDSGGITIVPIRCRDRLCPLCAHRRAREAAAKYGAAVARMDAARHIVLTAAAVADPLTDQLAELRMAFRRLRASRGWKGRVHGGVYSIEITRNKRTGHWHPHLHVIADGGYYPQGELVRDWQAALVSSSVWGRVHAEQPPVVHVSAVHQRHQLARYIAKYVSKPADISSWPRASICEYAAALRGMRVLHAFGSLHGAKLSGDEPNAVPDRSTVLVGLSELDWRAQQGYPAAEAAVAILRVMFQPCKLWFGARSDAPLEAWAFALEDPGEELQLQIASMHRQVATGPPGTDPRSKKQILREKIELRSKREPPLPHVVASRAES